jgi:hypothetical protein
MSRATPTPTFIRERPIPENPREPPLVPGEFLLKIDVRPGLARPCGWDMYFLGSTKKLDLNSTPACLGYPSTRRGFYDIVDGTTKVICPMCYQTFTTLDLENKHMQGPCQKFREKMMNPRKGPANKNRGKKGGKGDNVKVSSGSLRDRAPRGDLEERESSGHQEETGASGSQGRMESSGVLDGARAFSFLEDDRTSDFMEDERMTGHPEEERPSVRR